MQANSQQFCARKCWVVNVNCYQYHYLDLFLLSILCVLFRSVDEEVFSDFLEIRLFLSIERVCHATTYWKNDFVFKKPLDDIFRLKKTRFISAVRNAFELSRANNLKNTKKNEKKDLELGACKNYNLWGWHRKKLQITCHISIVSIFILHLHCVPIFWVYFNWITNSYFLAISSQLKTTGYKHDELLAMACFILYIQRCGVCQCIHQQRTSTKFQ